MPLFGQTIYYSHLMIQIFQGRSLWFTSCFRVGVVRSAQSNIFLGLGRYSYVYISCATSHKSCPFSTLPSHFMLTTWCPCSTFPSHFMLTTCCPCATLLSHFMLAICCPWSTRRSIYIIIYLLPVTPEPVFIVAAVVVFVVSCVFAEGGEAIQVP